MVGLTNRVGTPCKDCRSRHPKCHGQCEEYAAYLEDIKADKANRYAAYSEIDFYSMNNASRMTSQTVGCGNTILFRCCTGSLE